MDDTRKALEAVTANEGPAVKALGEVAALLHDATMRLATRTAALEGQRPMTFAGGWSPGMAYARGAVVQKGSGVYVALTDLAIDGPAPGQASAWRRLVGGSAS